MIVLGLKCIVTIQYESCMYLVLYRILIRHNLCTLASKLILIFTDIAEVFSVNCAPKLPQHSSFAAMWFSISSVSHVHYTHIYKTSLSVPCV